MRRRVIVVAAAIAFMAIAPAAPALAQPDWGAAYNVTHDKSAALCNAISYPCRGLRYYDSGVVGDDLWFKWAWRSLADCPASKPNVIWRLQINDRLEIVSWTPSGCTA